MITEGTPNKETVSAMLEAERIAKDSSVKGYHGSGFCSISVIFLFYRQFVLKGENA